MTEPEGAEVRGLGAPNSASARKHRAILDAAQEVFLSSGFLGANMDEVAAQAGVAKQTVYKHFGSKEALFVTLVTSMTSGASDDVLADVGALADDADAGAVLRAYAERQLEIVLTPRLLQLRRLVIGEVARFPELARALYRDGPARAISLLETIIGALAERGRLEVDDARLAASQFNWLVMGAPINEAMLLGDDAIPTAAERRKHAASAVRVFLAAYGARPKSGGR